MIILNFYRWWVPLICLVLSSTTGTFAAPLISEFMAANVSRLADEDGDFSDWIEVHNPDNVAVPLAGYHLTDDAANLDKWTFPAVNLNPGATLVVFASGKNRTAPSVPTARLHTNFRLSADGEYLALVAPDGVTVVSAFAPSYPRQFRDESFGLDLDSGPPLVDDLVWSFFSIPTPGKPNNNGTHAGPIISVVEKNPTQPEVGPLTVSVVVRSTNEPVATVKLYYRKLSLIHI